MEQIKIFRNQPFILIDCDFGEMMIFAIRYTLGNPTGAVKDVCEYVGSVLPHLDYRSLFCIKQDIEEHEEDETLKNKCDEVYWLKLKEEITKQIERMVEEAL